MGEFLKKGSLADGRICSIVECYDDVVVFCLDYLWSLPQSLRHKVFLTASAVIWPLRTRGRKYCKEQGIRFCVMKWFTWIRYWVANNWKFQQMHLISMQWYRLIIRFWVSWQIFSGRSSWSCLMHEIFIFNFQEWKQYIDL